MKNTIDLPGVHIVSLIMDQLDNVITAVNLPGHDDDEYEQKEYTAPRKSMRRLTRINFSTVLLKICRYMKRETVYREEFCLKQLS